MLLGYSSQHLGYRCLSLQTGKLFISLHVIFNEQVFPYDCFVYPPSPPSPPLSVTEGILGSIPLPIVPHPSPHSSPPLGTLEEWSAPSPSTQPTALHSPTTSPSPPPKYCSLQQIYQSTTPQPTIALPVAPQVSRDTTSHTCHPLPLCYAVITSLPSEPSSLADALHHPYWHHTMT